ncbi:hypothetical protein ACLOJK_032946 [Asimina triloba]
MAPPPVLSLALPSETGRVLSIQSHTVQIVEFVVRMHKRLRHRIVCLSMLAKRLIAFILIDVARIGFDWDLVPVQSSVIAEKEVPNKGLVAPVQFIREPVGQVLNGQQLWDLIEGLEANSLLYYTHLLTGYIGSASFLNTVLEVVDKLRSVNPQLIYVCDPVMGDEGKLYVPRELVDVYREKVVPVASMLTPNQFEAELLTGFRIHSESDGLEACNVLHAAGPSKVLYNELTRHLQEEALWCMLFTYDAVLIDEIIGVVITSAHIEDSLLLIGSHKKDHFDGLLYAVCSVAFYRQSLGLAGSVPTSAEQPNCFCHVFKALVMSGASLKYPDNLDRASELAVSSLQALLSRTVEDYKAAGFGTQSSSLEIRLIQSQDDIRSPKVNYKAVKYN